MAVEYIDSPNAGFIKLGEGVDLSTITPQQKRKIKRGDRGIFPITPTGAESYEGPDFKTQEAFSTPASAIPNVFDRYRTVPGGARAGGFPGGSFENVISPGTGNQNDDANDDDDDLEEELRRQTLDIGLDFDPSGRTDPNSPNYDAQAQKDIDRQVAENEAMMQAGIGLKDAIKVGILDKQYQMTGGKKGRSFNHSLESAYATGDPFAKYNIKEGSSEGYVPGTGGKPGTIGDRFIADTYGFSGIMDPITGGRSVAATSTEIPKVGFGNLEFNPLDPATLGFSPSVSPGVTETQGEDFGAASTPTGAGGAPTVGSVEGDLSLSGIDVDITPEPTGLSTDFEGGGDQAALESFFTSDFDFINAPND